MKVATNEQILEVLQQVISENTPWATIVDQIKQKYTIKNWLKVRGVLQWMISQNQVHRTNSVYVEEYSKN